LDERTLRKIEGHLRGTFANARINVVPRPRQKDSAEVYVSEEFIGVVFEDEDGVAAGSMTTRRRCRCAAAF